MRYSKDALHGKLQHEGHSSAVSGIANYLDPAN
jgi:hypothetical protein